MRTDIANGNDKTQVTDLDFEVSADYGSSWTNIASRCRAVDLSYTHNTGRWTANVDFNNHQKFRDAGDSLDPGHTSSYNPAGVPLLGAYHDVRVTVAKNSTGAVVFEGYVGPSDIESMEDVEMDDTIQCACVDIMQPWADYYIDKDLEGWTLEDKTLSTGSNCLGLILGHYGFAKTLVVEDDPSYYLYHYEMGDINVLTAVSNPINSIGFVLMTKWNSTESEFRPTIVDPMRDDTTADADLAGKLGIIRTRYTEANVRTKIRWVYKDRTTGKSANVICSDADALALYGIPNGSGGRLHKYMRISEKDLSVLDTRAETLKACGRALHDVSKPCAGVEVRIPWLCLNIEGGDLIQFTTHSETVKVGVTGIRHHIEPGTVGSTTISGTLDYRVGNQMFWLMNGRTDWRGQQDNSDKEVQGPAPLTPTKLDMTEVWADADDGSTVPALHLTWGATNDWRTKGYRVLSSRAKLEDSGTTTSGTDDSLTDTAKAWIPHEHIGRYVQLGGTRDDAEATREIISNTATVLNFHSVTTAVTGSETYKILERTTAWDVMNTDQYPLAQLSGPAGQYMIAKVAVVPNSIDK